jgi:hypothetical protein
VSRDFEGKEQGEGTRAMGTAAATAPNSPLSAENPTFSPSKPGSGSVPGPNVEVSQLVDAAAVAAYLGVTPGWVYEHKEELGARRLGTGPKARLRFSLEEVDRRLTCSESRGSEGDEEPVTKPSRRRRASRDMGTNVALLPIRGRSTEPRP